MIRLQNNKWSFFKGVINPENGNAFVYEHHDQFIRYDWIHGSRIFNTIQEAMSGKHNSEVITTLFEGQ